MAKPFDNTTRYLTGLDPLSWVRFLGIKAESAELCNADLSTVSTQADAIVLTDHGKDAIHIENMASYDSEIPIRLVLYNVLGRKILKLPVRSFVVLLCREADNPSLTGIVREYHSDGSLCHEFHYGVARIWQIPAEKLFESGLGILPLAFIGDIDPARLPDLVRRTEERLAREATPTQTAEIWTAIDILMGLRYEEKIVNDWFKGVRSMKESVTYQAILEEGAALSEIRHVREFVIRRIARRFGLPDAQTVSFLESIDSVDKFDDLEERSLMVSNWKELIGA